MSDIVEWLHAHLASDHDGGCMGQQYSCSCGYDAETEKLLAAAAAEIEWLRAENQTAWNKADELDERARHAEAALRRALEPKP